MSDPIKIEKGVPIPSKFSTKYGSIKETLRAMEPGDSFFTTSRSRRAYMYGLAQRLDLRLKILSCTESGVAGFRVWRLADKT